MAGVGGYVQQRLEQERRNAPPTPADIVASKAEQGKKKLQTAGVIPNDTLTTEDAIAILRDAGADVNDPGLRSLLADPGVLQWLQDPQTGQAIIAGLVQQYPKALTPYEQLISDAGFAAPAPTGLTDKSAEQIAQQAQRDAVRGYTTSPSTGAIKFTNGVVVDTDGNVYYPPDRDVEGSATWRREIQSTWSDKDIQTWRKKLVDMGYLPKGAQKMHGFDTAFLDALTAYHNTKYANGGREVARDLGGANGQPAVDLNLFRPEIENEVRSTFLDVFKDNPTPTELARWSRLIIQTGNRYQQKGLDPGASLSQAKEKIVSDIYTSPEGQFFQDSEQENTTLHDALVNAARATDAVMR